MDLYDIHTHNASPSLIDGFNVCSILNTYPSDFERSYVNKSGLFFSCGIHPWYSQDVADDLNNLVEIVQNKSVVAIGEIGLDKLQGPNVYIQKQLFIKQIEMAVDVHKPIIIHCVKAWDDLIALHRKYKGAQPWIIHGFRGGRIQAKQLLDMGFMVSVGEYYNLEALKSIPLDSLFCETDMSKTTILSVYHKVSDTLAIQFDKLVTILAYNVQKTFFKK